MPLVITIYIADTDKSWPKGYGVWLCCVYECNEAQLDMHLSKHCLFHFPPVCANTHIHTCKIYTHAQYTHMHACTHTQAVIGIAFSIGFLLGPMIGAAFSVWGKSTAETAGDSFTIFQYPALFALSLSLLDIALLVFAFPETLPEEKRARSLGHGMLGTLHLINPLSLFRFRALSKINSKGYTHVYLCTIA